MILLLSPAKSLNLAEHSIRLPITSPRLDDMSQVILARAKKLKPQQLAELMGISPALSQLNYERFQSFGAQASMPAVFMFDGDVYDGLQARTLDDAGLEFATNHVRILSGLYGLLRPLDEIRPYRLEMGTKLDIKKSKSLYQFWGQHIAGLLEKDLKAQGDTVVVNLASQEYAKAALINGFNADIITPRFLDIKDGKARILSFFAKQARGTMARYIIDNRLSKSDSLKNFNGMGYAYDEQLSSQSDFVFTRQQPPAMASKTNQ